MTDALQSLLPDRLDPYADVMVGIFTAIVILFVGWVAAKWGRAVLQGALKRHDVDVALTKFLGGIVQYLLIAVAVITALQRVGVPVMSAVAMLGAAGLAIGLALQGSLSNFASGVMILLFRPFSAGDRVTVNGLTGTVEEVGLHATTLMTPDLAKVIMPNSEIMTSAITNYTWGETARVPVDIGVAYGTDYATAERALLQVAGNLENVREDPAPQVVLNGFGASSVDLQLRLWTDPPNVFALAHQARVAIYAEFERQGIEIPFDQVVVHRAEDGD